jgi:acyl-CoA reductase-like NAD-dependent aldehyde dehydrogenase
MADVAVRDEAVSLIDGEPLTTPGQVKINGVRRRERPGVAFGGVGESGYGRELGALGIKEFTDVTAVMA